MDDSKWESVDDAPTFLGIVQDPFHHDGWDAEDIDEETESYVTFALYGHYEWDPNDMMNHSNGKFEDMYLNIIAYPPTDNKLRRNFGDKDPLRHFEKGDGKWVFKTIKTRVWIADLLGANLKKRKVDQRNRTVYTSDRRESQQQK